MTQRIAVVTGGSRGLGKNAALKLAAKGTDIILTWNSNAQAALDVVAEIEQTGVKAAALPLNVGDVSSFDSFAQKVREVLQQRWQRETFDYLLNNAGIGLNIPCAETRRRSWARAEFRSISSRPARLKPILAAVWSGITRR